MSAMQGLSNHLAAVAAGSPQGGLLSSHIASRQNAAENDLMAMRKRFSIHAGMGFAASSSGRRSLVDKIAMQVRAGSPLASPVGKRRLARNGELLPPTRRQFLRRRKRSVSGESIAIGNEREESKRRSTPSTDTTDNIDEAVPIYDSDSFEVAEDNIESDNDEDESSEGGLFQVEFEEYSLPEEENQASKTSSFQDKRSTATSTTTSWVNGAIGTMKARMANGTETVVTDASNIFVVEGGFDTSAGLPLMGRIVTQNQESTPNAPFWLIDETGDFCTNSATNLCYITLGHGLNAAPYSLIPYDRSQNGDKPPPAEWTIDPTTGQLTYLCHAKEIIFSQNENDFGNGDIDGWSSNKLKSGYTQVTLFLYN